MDFVSLAFSLEPYIWLAGWVHHSHWGLWFFWSFGIRQRKGIAEAPRILGVIGNPSIWMVAFFWLGHTHIV
jgi:hypothetical protein